MLAETSGTNAAEIRLRASITGVYTVLVSNNFPNSQVGAANYVLTVAKTPGPYTISSGDEGGSLTNGANHIGSIYVGDQDTWTFDATFNDSINLSLAEVSVVGGPDPGFYPRLTLIRPDGVTVNDVSGTNATEIRTRAPITGVYTVLVANNFPNSQIVNSSVNYTLTMARTPGPYTISSGDEGGPMTNGVTHTGVIGVGDIDTWILHATANNSLSFNLSEVLVGGPDPGFYPRLTLIGPDGATLNDTSGTNTALIDRLVPLTGVYTVLVANNFPNSQSGAVSYTLAFTGPPQPTLSINNASLNEGNGGTTPFVFNVTLSSPVTQIVNVNYATANMTAIAPVDYTAIPITQLAFNPGEMSKTVTVSVNGDTSVEPDETFFVNLSGALVVKISTPQGTGTIINDDSTIQFSSATYNVNENGGNATATVTRTGSSTGTVTALCATSNGTATAGQDYTAVSNTLTWADGDTAPKTCNVSIIDDTVFEGNETVNLTLSNPTGGSTIAAPNTAVLTIVDNETQPTLSINDVTQNEGNSGTTPFTFNVSLSGQTTQTVTVNYATADGTATAPSDYTAISLTQMTFSPLELTKSITVLVNGDTTIEPNETFFVNLSGASNATFVNPQGTGTIIDDDNITFVVVSGRVLTSDLRGLRNATVSITDSNGVRRTATTSSFGFFSFDNVATGQQYTFRVQSRLYRYSPRTVTVNDNLTLPDFVGLE